MVAASNRAACAIPLPSSRSRVSPDVCTRASVLRFPRDTVTASQPASANAIPSARIPGMVPRTLTGNPRRAAALLTAAAALPRLRPCVMHNKAAGIIDRVAVDHNRRVVVRFDMRTRSSKCELLGARYNHADVLACRDLAHREQNRDEPTRVIHRARRPVTGKTEHERNCRQPQQLSPGPARAGSQAKLQHHLSTRRSAWRRGAQRPRTSQRRRRSGRAWVSFAILNPSEQPARLLGFLAWRSDSRSSI